MENQNKMQFQREHLLRMEDLQLLIDGDPQERADVLTKNLKHYIFKHRCHTYIFDMEKVIYEQIEDTREKGAIMNKISAYICDSTNALKNLPAYQYFGAKYKKLSEESNISKTYTMIKERLYYSNEKSIFSPSFFEMCCLF